MFILPKADIQMSRMTIPVVKIFLSSMISNENLKGYNNEKEAITTKALY